MWIKWYPVEWLQSTCRDELNPAERATFQDYCCLAALPGKPVGEFKFSSLEALSRKLNTNLEIIEKTNEKCILFDRIKIKKNREGFVCKILNWYKYQALSSQKSVNKNKNNSSGMLTKSAPRIEENRIDKNILLQAKKLATLLAKLILQNNPKNISLNKDKKENSLKSWAEDIEKLIRIDGCSYQEIEKIINWCQKDSFWNTNILSGKTLRKQYDKLLPKMQKDTKEVSDDRFNFSGGDKKT